MSSEEDGRAKLATLARETLEICRQGFYEHPKTGRVDIGAELEAARKGTVLYRPEELAELERRLDEQYPGPDHNQPTAQIQVSNETTLSAARRLGEEGREVAALNFASATNPGGGFLKGSPAQEESLARSSGLYPCLENAPEYYRANRQAGTALYTDHIIYSPRVPVFRDHGGELLECPYLVSFITAPAVNARVVRALEPGGRVEAIPAVMEKRIGRILAVAVARGYSNLVLGAFGCGVFGNDPELVANLFARFLLEPGLYRTAFRRVHFAVLDRKPGQRTYGIFRARFS